AGLFLVAALSLSCPSYAQIVQCTHGQSGHIQDTSITTVPSYWGWGLDFILNSGNSDWVHFAVPTVLFEKTRYLAIKFATGSVDAIVNQVDIWSGNTLVKQFLNLNWTTSGPSDAQWKILDLGSDVNFESIGISVGIGAGVEAMSHRFLFHSVCAEFHP
ncbi:MAG TPA: hypothetical protein VFG09_14835, partial [Thermodesulfovibrionales bacterium]|nr:hypothetical protein [Thermodesulfovibrionales bacterium]